MAAPRPPDPAAPDPSQHTLVNSIPNALPRLCILNTQIPEGVECGRLRIGAGSWAGEASCNGQSRASWCRWMCQCQLRVRRAVRVSGCLARWNALHGNDSRGDLPPRRRPLRSSQLCHPVPPLLATRCLRPTPAPCFPSRRIPARRRDAPSTGPGHRPGPMHLVTHGTPRPQVRQPVVSGRLPRWVGHPGVRTRRGLQHLHGMVTTCRVDDDDDEDDDDDDDDDDGD